MDQILISIVFLIVITTMLSAVVLPIIALVISIRTKKKLTEQISRLAAGQSPPVPGASTIGAVRRSVPGYSDPATQKSRRNAGSSNGGPFHFHGSAAHRARQIRDRANSRTSSHGTLVSSRASAGGFARRRATISGCTRIQARWFCSVAPARPVIDAAKEFGAD